MALLSLALVLVGYLAAGRQYYHGFRVPQGFGMYHLLPEEAAHYLLFAVFGSAAMACAFVALRGLPLLGHLVSLVERAAAPRWLGAGLAAAIVLVTTVSLRLFVMGPAVLTDDEHTYRFIAQTLRTGALTAPSPGEDLEFYREQFVVLTSTARYGKYPIGHPLLLALGQSASVESLVVPVLTALIAFPLAAIGRRLYGPKVTFVALGLFALSPQVWFTGASYLSQPASALCLAGALAASLRQEGSPDSRWSALAGLCLGFGVLVRPLPGVLFVLPALAFALRRPSGRWRRAVGLLAPVASAAVALLLVNQAQSGAALTSGYQAFHATEPGGGSSLLAVMQGDAGAWAMSLAAAVVRENFWLLGWPLSLGLCLLAGRGAVPLLLGGTVAAELAYRLMAPKAGVGGAGPLYLFEIVGLLCLLSARGLALLARGEAVLRVRMGAEGAAAIVLAGVLVAQAMFLPPKLDDLRRMSGAQRELPRALRSAGVRRALVFHDGAVPPTTGLSWAYFPPHNSPRMDDDILFVRVGRDGVGRLGPSFDFWRRRYPDRDALYFAWTPRRGPFLVTLEELARLEPIWESQGR
jgi:hypothetical protein